jgi:hypothetical protein
MSHAIHCMHLEKISLMHDCHPARHQEKDEGWSKVMDGSCQPGHQNKLPPRTTVEEENQPPRHQLQPDER